MHSFGNDFIIINDINSLYNHDYIFFSKYLCNRYFGIGADGLIIINKSNKADYMMRIFNCDGSEANMCGNGIRCLAKYLFDNEVISKNKITIETLAGVMQIEQFYSNENKYIKVNMGIPIIDKRYISYPIEIFKKIFLITKIIIGNNHEHCVIFLENIDKKVIKKYGPIIENHNLFPNKVNVNFVEIISFKDIKVVTWERGVGLSKSCGTGACASAVATYLNKKTDNNINVHLMFGNLNINLKNNYILMTGLEPSYICMGQVLLKEIIEKYK